MPQRKGPRNINELSGLLSMEKTVRDWLFSLKYPQGFACLYCGGRTCWPTARGYLHCASCGRETSLKKDTIFQGSKTPLSQWFKGLFLFASLKGGITAEELKTHMGFSSYQTAWAWLSRFREAAKGIVWEQLSGQVQADQIFYRGDGSGNPFIIAAAVEKGARNRIEGVRMELLKELSSIEMRSFLLRNLQPGTTVECDGWNLLTEKSLRFSILEKIDPYEPVPAVRLVQVQFFRWMNRVHPGPLTSRQLPRYIADFLFRFNYRKEKDPGKVFSVILEASVRRGGLPAKLL